MSPTEIRETLTSLEPIGLAIGRAVAVLLGSLVASLEPRFAVRSARIR